MFKDCPKKKGKEFESRLSIRSALGCFAARISNRQQARLKRDARFSIRANAETTSAVVHNAAPLVAADVPCAFNPGAILAFP